MERVARGFAAGVDCEHDPDALDQQGEPRWRSFVDMAISAIASWKLMTER